MRAETLPAERAGERLLSRVAAFVNLELTSVSVRLVADVADEGFST